MQQRQVATGIGTYRTRLSMQASMQASMQTSQSKQTGKESQSMHDLTMRHMVLRPSRASASTAMAADFDSSSS